jgi:alkylhydroperoxidase/carboxymuconolactone decarboxylase family protein YurZ
METQTKQASITASTETSSNTSMQTVSDVQNVSPALERYKRTTLFGDLWNRPDLSLRDRSMVTLAALIARSQTIELPASLKMALDHGVTPGEISEIIAHLAFYSAGRLPWLRSRPRRRSSPSAASAPITVSCCSAMCGSARTSRRGIEVW